MARDGAMLWLGGPLEFEKKKLVHIYIGTNFAFFFNKITPRLPLKWQAPKNISPIKKSPIAKSQK